MRRGLLILLMLALPFLAGSLPEEQGSTAVKSPTPLEWRWSAGKASLAYCTKVCLPDYDVGSLHEFCFFTPITIRRKKDRKLVYTIKDGTSYTTFTRWQGILYIADYSPATSGCSVIALELKTGNQLWKTQLQGIGPRANDRYRNLVNIETDGQVIIVTGNEMAGRYIEHLDLETGKTLANKKLVPE